MAPKVRIWLLGPPRFQVANQDIKFGTRKAVALIAYLAVTGQPQSRDTLTAMLWPESDHRSASQAFRQTLYAARRRLGKHLLPGIDKQIVLDDSGDVWIDLKEFNAAAGAGLGGHLQRPEAIASLKKAAGLYQGDLLAGFTLKDSPEFDQWQSFESLNLRQKHGRVLETLVRIHSAQGLHDQALAYALRKVQFDPLDEVAHCYVMQAYVQTGQRAAALRHYDECAQTLYQHLHVEPSEETRKLREMIATEQTASPRTVVVDADPLSSRATWPSTDLAGPEDVARIEGKPSQTPGLTSPADGAARPRHNLPSLATPFVGRENELADLARLIVDPDSRLITILAPGGMGKTRLALEMACQMVATAPGDGRQSIFPNGVWLVELAQIKQVEEIVDTIADAVGFRFQSGRRSAKQQLLDYFRAKNTLLIMDNFEHLLDGAGIVGEIVQAAPQVTIVSTSREKLNLYGETVLTLGGLVFPEGGTLEDILQYDAIKIFMNSARRVCPEYELRPDALGHLKTICRQCYGMPLAIELAASWVEALSLAEIAVEIGQNLDFLNTMLRDVPERHYSVRATFDHSWKLLKTNEQRIFARFAVFPGSFSREAALAVTGARLQQLTRLVNKSLLRRNAERGRYNVHELLRQYAEEKLEAGGELTPMRQGHSRYYLAAVHGLQEDLDGKDQIGAMKRIESDIKNVRTALFHAVSCGFYTQLVPALYNLWRFYLIRGQFLLGEMLFTQVADGLRQRPQSPERDQALGEALAYQSSFSSEHRDLQKAGTALEECETLLKDVADPRLQVVLAYTKARFYVPSGRPQKARPLLEEAIGLCRQLGDRFLEAHGLHRLSNSYWLQINYRDMGLATHYMEEAYRIRLEINDTLGIAWSLSSLGSYATTEKRYDEGERLMLQGLSLYRQVGHLEAAPHNLAVYAMRRGRWNKARQYMNESLAIAREVGDLNMVSWRLWILGNIEFHTGDFARAQAFYREGEAVGEAIGNTTWLSNCWIGLGNVALAVGDYPLAKQHFNRSLAIWQEGNYKNLIPASYRNLGQVARLTEEFSKAHEYFDQALAMFSELEDEEGGLITQRERALLFFDEARLPEARRTAEEILEILSDDQAAEEILNPLVLMITLMVCHTLLGTIACREDDSKGAIHHYRGVLAVADQNYPTPYMLTFVARSAGYFSDLGDDRRATRIAAFVTHDERAFAYDRRYASALLSELKGSVDAAGFQAAVRRGRAWDLAEVIEMLRGAFRVGLESLA